MICIHIIIIALLLVAGSILLGLLDMLASTAAGQAFLRWAFERMGVDADEI